MKIAIISDTFYPQINGVCNTLGKMTQYMENNNIEYQFYVPKWGENPDLEQANQDNVERYDALKPWFYPECRLAIPSPYNYERLKRSLSNFNPDIVHIVTEFSLGLMGLKAASSLEAALVMSYHTDIPGYLKHYNLPFMANTLSKYLQWFHSFAELNLVPSQHTMEQLKKNGFRDLAFWKRGINCDTFSPAYRSLELREEFGAGKIPLLLYVGRIAIEKELDVLVEAANVMNEKGLHFKLAMIGDGPYRKELEAKQIPNIVFLGYKEGLALQQYYASSDIFVFPSSTETYGNVVLEAMASGLPVVAPLSGGIKENLIDNHNGLKFMPGNYRDMAKKIEELILNKDFREQLAQNARKDAEKKTWAIVFDELFNSYDSLIRRKRIRSA